MLRTLKLPMIAPPQPQRLIALALLAVAGAAGRAAARLLREPAPVEIAREFGTIEIDGRRVGAVYENGRLIALLPGVARL